MSADLSGLDWGALFTGSANDDWELFKNVLLQLINNHCPLTSIPLVTDDTLLYIADGHLVCVRGMIQDMFDSELYISSYRPSAEATSVKSTRYREVEYLQSSSYLFFLFLCLFFSLLTFFSTYFPPPTRFHQTGRVSPLTLAAWNVRALLDNPRSIHPERRTALMARELARYKVDMAALSETRFSEQGQLEEVGAGYIFFWSGRLRAERRDAGVAFAIRKNIVGRLLCLCRASTIA
nr:unnamed protein product [Spirometra erinaceieuropaei]